jgi:predicted nucleic acid-binding protein
MSTRKVFLDANVFVAAARSPSGGSRVVLELACKGRIQIVTVTHALIEAERNIKIKFGDRVLETHYELLLRSKPVIQSIASVTLQEIAFLERFVPRKDTPILLGALYSRSKVLLTLDRRDFLENKSLKKLRFPFVMVTPGEFIRSLKA